MTSYGVVKTFCYIMQFGGAIREGKVPSCTMDFTMNIIEVYSSESGYVRLVWTPGPGAQTLPQNDCVGEGNFGLGSGLWVMSVGLALHLSLLWKLYIVLVQRMFLVGNFACFSANGLAFQHTWYVGVCVSMTKIPVNTEPPWKYSGSDKEFVLSSEWKQ